MKVGDRMLISSPEEIAEFIMPNRVYQVVGSGSSRIACVERHRPVWHQPCLRAGNLADDGPLAHCRNTRPPAGEFHIAAFDWSNGSMLYPARATFVRSMKDISGGSGVVGTPQSSSAKRVRGFSISSCRRCVKLLWSCRSLNHTSSIIWNPCARLHAWRRIESRYALISFRRRATRFPAASTRPAGKFPAARRRKSPPSPPVSRQTAPQTNQRNRKSARKAGISQCSRFDRRSGSRYKDWT